MPITNRMANTVLAISLAFSNPAMAHHSSKLVNLRCGDTDRINCTQENMGVHAATHAACYYRKANRTTLDKARDYIFNERKSRTPAWMSNWMSANNLQYPEAIRSTNNFNLWVAIRESPGWAFNDYSSLLSETCP